LASSPGVANFGLRKAALDSEDNFSPNVTKFMQENFYVDDGLCSVASVTEAVEIVKGSQEICANSGLNLHKFVSNSREVLHSITAGDRADRVKNLDLDKDLLPMERALGVAWCVESDTFRFRVVIHEYATTRRGMLSTVCSIFDPLGLIAPVTLQGKIMLQTLCKEQYDWDEPLPDHLKVAWEKWLSELPGLGKLAISRCFKPPDFKDVVSAELHHFSDASTLGYGTCAYLRLVDVQGMVNCSLVMAKSRVAPLQSITIPRLELTAAVLSTEVSTLLDKELQYPKLQQFFWTDSKIVLGFISNDSKRFHVYVANRIQKIRDFSEPSQWHHISGCKNLADLSSRGTTATQLMDSEWFRGPQFLWESQVSEAGEGGPYALPTPCDEVKSSCLVVESHEQPFQVSSSSWVRTKKVVAICLKFLSNLKNKTRGWIAVEDLEKAELVLVTNLQKAHFSEEIVSIQSGKCVATSSRLRKLDPFLDANGILRVGGRIKQASLPFEERHPVVLPKSDVTDTIVRFCHEKTGHQGRGMTIAAVRSRGYWILGLSSVVSTMIFKCVTCRRLRAAPLGQKMAPLPEDRLQPGPAFTYVATDCFGPFYIQERRKELKRYGMIITCLTSRAIHIETVPSMTTDSFLNALRRFISIRGPIRSLRCDQGTNFMGGIAELHKTDNYVDKQKVEEFLLKDSCEFKVNPPCASHQGGIWERQIRTARSVLQTLLFTNGRQLDDDGLRTLMYETSNIVNSRPLSAINDPLSPQPLCPNMLLHAKSNVVLPPYSQDADLYSTKRWRRVQHLADCFWQRWRKEIVQNLQQRSKWCQTHRNLQVGDIVLAVDEALPRCFWRLGRVTEVFPGTDGLVRRVKFVQGDPSLSKQCKTFERPIHKLVLLLENEQS
jgi:hypothetical protein